MKSRFLITIAILLCLLPVGAQQVNKTMEMLPQTTILQPQDIFLVTTGMVGNARSTRGINTSNLLESLSAQINWNSHVPIQAIAPTNGMGAITNGQLIVLGVNLSPGTNVVFTTNGLTITISSTASGSSAAVTPTNGIAMSTNNQVVTIAGNYAPGQNISFTTNGLVVTVSSSSSLTGTNSTFYLAGTSGFFNVLSTNGFNFFSVSNGVITFNTNVVFNGLVTMTFTNLDALSNLLVTGWATINGKQTNSSLTGPGFYLPDANGGLSVGTFGSGLTLNNGVLSASGGAALPSGTNNGDMIGYHGGNWLVMPLGEKLMSATSTNSTATNLASFVTGTTLIPITNGYSLRVTGDFIAAGATNTGAWTKVALFRNDTGTLTLVQSNQLAGPLSGQATNWNCQYVVNGTTNLVVQGVGDSAEVVSWRWQGWVEMVANAVTPASYLIDPQGNFVIDPQSNKIIAVQPN